MTLDSLITTLRKSLERIRYTPPVPIQSAHAAAVDLRLEQAGDLAVVARWLGEAADGTTALTPETCRAAETCLRRVIGVLSASSAVFAAPDAVEFGMTYG